MANTVTMPKMGFDMAEGTLLHWRKAINDPIAKGEILAEIETDKATVEVNSPYDGILARLLVEPGSIVPVSTPIAIIAAPGEKIEELASKVSETPPTAVLESEKPSAVSVEPGEPQPAARLDNARIKASPLAKRIALVEGVDLSKVKGSGPEGRIVRKDIEGMTNRQEAPILEKTAGEEVSSEAAVSPVKNDSQADEVVPLDKLRKIIGRRMAEAKQQIPHIYLTREVKVDALVALRKQVNAILADDQKITLNDFIVKAVALALKQYPNLNASLSGENLIRHHAINIGVAVAVPGGLMTVVSLDADQKSLSTISAEIKEKAARARERKVRPEDIENSTFTISNLGMYHIEEFGAIVNPPEVAILAVGEAKLVPVIQDGALAAGMRMKVTLSSDHRVTDGAESAQFLEALSQLIEEPMKLLL